MKCPTCGSAMRPLFTSYYCAACDERKANPPKDRPPWIPDFKVARNVGLGWRPLDAVDEEDGS